MTLPATIPVTRNPHTGDTEDGLGNTTPTFGAPVALKAISVAPHTVEQGSATATETEVADVDLFIAKIPVNLKDRFTIDDISYDVVGLQDWTKGFHGWRPGIVVELRRVR